jgi:hypothetical protein
MNVSRYSWALPAVAGLVWIGAFVFGPHNWLFLLIAALFFMTALAYWFRAKIKR